MIIEFKEIDKGYKTKFLDTKVLEKCNFKINRGDLVSIIGKSGCGKSTLLNLLGMIDTPDNGVYKFDGVNINNLNSFQKANIRNTKIGFIYQNFSLIEDISVIQNVIVPLKIRKIKKFEMLELAQNALKQVGILECANKKVYELSGGQRQRVAIARTIAQDTQVILADEPTGNLDLKTSQEILDIMFELNKQGKTIIIVTHDLEIADSCKRRFKIENNSIVEY